MKWVRYDPAAAPAVRVANKSAAANDALALDVCANIGVQKATDDFLGALTGSHWGRGGNSPAGSAAGSDSGGDVVMAGSPSGMAGMMVGVTGARSGGELEQCLVSAAQPCGIQSQVITLWPSWL